MKQKTKRQPSELQYAAINAAKLAGLPEPTLEHRFAPPRQWRFDLAWPELKLAVECEGGIWTGGRHTRGKGFEDDCVKYNAAALLGWTLLRFTGGMLSGPVAVAAMLDFRLKRGVK